MRTNTDCTVYNHYRNEGTGHVEVHKTYLSAVFWESRKAVNRIKSGMAEADGITVLVPLSVEAEGKYFVDPVGYAQLAPDQVKHHWTLAEGTDYLAKGDAPPASSTKELKTLLPGIYEHFKITTVDPKLYGSKRLQHWELSGK